MERLNELRNAFRKETNQLYKNTEINMLKNEKTFQSFMKNTENSVEILQIAEKNGTSQQKFITFEIARQQINSHYHQLESHLKDDVEVHFTTKISKALIDIEGTLTSLGCVEISSKPITASKNVLQGIMNNLNSRTKISTEMCATQVQKLDLMTSSVTFVKSVTREKLGKETNFIAGTYLADGRLVMADLNNKRLVQLDDEYNVVKEYKIDDQPIDVAVGHIDNEIYITVSQGYIYKCTLDTKLTIVSRIKAPSFTWGIAVSGDNLIVGTPDAEVILTKDGSIVKSIPKSGYYGYVAVSQTQRTMYHRDNNDIVCRTLEGTELFRYKNQKLEAPRGITIDTQDTLYICGCDSDNVHQVSSDGQKSRILLDKLHYITQPWNVIFNTHKNELIVTSCNENTVFEIYRLS